MCVILLIGLGCEHHLEVFEMTFHLSSLQDGVWTRRTCTGTEEESTEAAEADDYFNGTTYLWLCKATCLSVHSRADSSASIPGPSVKFSTAQPVVPGTTSVTENILRQTGSSTLSFLSQGTVYVAVRFALQLNEGHFFVLLVNRPVLSVNTESI